MADVLQFGPFRFDLVDKRVWRRNKPLKLSPKAVAVLRCLLERPGGIVTREALFAAVWPQTVVSDAVLSVCIRELRQALEDHPRSPQYIETVHRQGFRFIAELHIPQADSEQIPVVGLPRRDPPADLVGRAIELRQLLGWLREAEAGARQLVFVTGEAGIGKTALVEEFYAQAAATGGLLLGRGQSIKHFSAGEAYLPVLTALEQLCQSSEQERVRSVLRQYAPTWLIQLPTLLKDTELEELQRQTAGVARQRMLREIAGALEVLTAAQPLVLILEDLHWSDNATLALLSYLARRRQRARLLVVATYRPVETLIRDHPLRSIKQELQLHGLCAELALGPLDTAAVQDYLDRRFPGHQLPAALARVLYARTEGNPLFLTAVVNDWVTQGAIAPQEKGWILQRPAGEISGQIPESLRQLITHQLERLNREERQVLEAASVAGVEFSATAVAAGVGGKLVRVEALCEDLTWQYHLLQPHGVATWPDRTVANRYRFLHALYREVLYAQVPVGRRKQIHQRIGERLAAAYGERCGEIAVELAQHFEEGYDERRAAFYHRQAAQIASQRGASQEAISHLLRGLDLLQSLPDTTVHTADELTLQLALGPLLMATRGYAAPEVTRTYARAHALCQQLGDTAQLFSVLRGLWVSALLRAELSTAHELGQQLLTLADSVHDNQLLVEGHYALGATLFFQGEATSARTHLEKGAALYTPSQPGAHATAYGQDPGVFCRLVGALTLWVLGYAEQALERIKEGLALSRELGHANSHAGALSFAAWLHLLRREGEAACVQAAAVRAFSAEQELLLWGAWGTIMEGCVLAEHGQGGKGTEQIRQGLTDVRGTGAVLVQPYILARLGEAATGHGQLEEGKSFVTEAIALIQRTGERWYEAEAVRLQGELALQRVRVHRRDRQASTHTIQRNGSINPSAPPSPSAGDCRLLEAESYFSRAVAIARHQSAKSLELRAVLSLSRLWQQQGKKDEARRMLAEIYAWFSEGFDTKDLQEAKTLLDDLREGAPSLLKGIV